MQTGHLNWGADMDGCDLNDMRHLEDRKTRQEALPNKKKRQDGSTRQRRCKKEHRVCVNSAGKSCQKMQGKCKGVAGCRRESKDGNATARTRERQEENEVQDCEVRRREWNPPNSLKDPRRW